MSLDYTIQNRGRITFQGDGITATTTTYNEGQRPSRSVSRDGYRLVGWSNGSTTYAPDQVPLVTCYDVTYTAVWEEIIYTITWDYDGGVCGGKTSATEKQPARYSSVSSYETHIPKKAGYSFIGWDASKPGGFISQDGYKGYTSTYSGGWQVSINSDNSTKYKLNFSGATGNDWRWI